MSFQPIAGEILSVSAAAMQVMQRSAAKLKAKPKPAAINRGRGDLATQMFRTRVRMTLLAGGNPHHYSLDLVESLEAADPAVRRAVDAWYARRVQR